MITRILRSIFWRNKTFSYEPFSKTNIKWSDNFNPSYVQRVISVVKHPKTDESGNHYGHVSSGYYLPNEYKSTEHFYNTGELFIISVLRESLDRKFHDLILDVNNSTNTFLYILVRVNSDSRNGFDIIDIVEQQRNYPWHENILVASIMKSNLLP